MSEMIYFIGKEFTESENNDNDTFNSFGSEILYLMKEFDTKNININIEYDNENRIFFVNAVVNSDATKMKHGL